MKIWIDVDACPRGVKQILFRATNRLHVPLCLLVTADVPLDPRGELYSMLHKMLRGQQSGW